MMWQVSIHDDDEVSCGMFDTMDISCAYKNEKEKKLPLNKTTLQFTQSLPITE